MFIQILSQQRSRGGQAWWWFDVNATALGLQVVVVFDWTLCKWFNSVLWVLLKSIHLEAPMLVNLLSKDMLHTHRTNRVMHILFLRQGHLSMVVTLMSYGADPTLIDGEGCGCIHLACQFGHTAIVAYLIAKGQDVNVIDLNGMTPLMWSSYRVFAWVFPIHAARILYIVMMTACHWECFYCMCVCTCDV